MVADVRLALGRSVEIHVLISSKQLFDNKVRGRRTTEQSLPIEIASALELYSSFEIVRVGLVMKAGNRAKNLTKLTDNGVLTRILSTQ